VITYTCTISDATYSDLVIPITSFQLRLRQSPKQCYVSVQIPSILDYASDINDRIDGEITVTQVYQATPAATATETDVITANVDSFRVFLGPLNRSGQVVGYKQITFPGTGSVAIEEPQYRAFDGTTYRFRSAPSPDLKPGDEAVVSGWETITVEEIVWTISQTSKIMEFSA